MNQAQYNDWLRQCSHVTAHVPEGEVEDAIPLYCNSNSNQQKTSVKSSQLIITFLVVAALAIFLS